MISTVSLLSSSAIPTTRGDRLLVRVSTKEVGPIDVRVQIQFENADGSINYTHETVTVPPGQRSVEARIPTTDGRLLRVAAWMPGYSWPPGSIFVQLALLFGSAVNNANILYLNQGYISAGNAVLYPPEPSETALQIDMMPILEIDPDPSPGGSVGFTPVGASFAEFTWGRFTFTADAGVANRRALLTMNDTNGYIFGVNGRTDITANQERTFHLWRGPNMPADDTTFHYIPLPELLWLDSASLNITFANMQAGDQISAVTFGYRSNRRPSF